MTPQNLLKSPLNTQKCTLGCPVLDRCLDGGIPCNSVTELVAESGSGKTQLCLQLSLMAQLPSSLGGLASSSLYIHTEFPFPIRRLHQLSTSFQHLHPQLYVHGDNPCDYVFVRSVYSADQLLDIMSKAEFFIANLKTRLPVRLVVIDSIAALFRSEFENTPCDLKRRSSLFFKLSGKLKALALRFNLAVVVTNQVVDMVEPNQGVNGVRVGNLRCLYSSGRRVCPALGLAWANCVNSRLFLSRYEEVDREENGGGKGQRDFLCKRTMRQLHVVFAPHLPYSSCEFVVTRDGVLGVNI
ncbi:Rad51 domain-containing protein [Cephalotus follicularis]|uniref:Rad51 domain-containing protein n=1 Tax=Cephalotus follicularis TaxID=3775 RepID=A0A1Q3AVJ9_CEPFO|nr:Rad51 domain-containing protein [Cephalotus follicularis]